MIYSTGRIYMEREKIDFKMTMGNQIKFLVSGSVMDTTVVSMCVRLKTFRNFPNWKTKVIYS